MQEPRVRFKNIRFREKAAARRRAAAPRPLVCACAARTANVVRQAFAYDARGQLVAVRENGADVERYAYDSPRTGIRGNPCPSVDDSKYVAMTCATVGTKSRRRYTAAALTTAFGESVRTSQAFQTFFTGKPQVERLGYAFLYRNYRASLAKWQTADPLGYPDGRNRLAYCENGVTGAVDLFGAKIVYIFTEWICQYDPTGVGGYPPEAEIIRVIGSGHEIYSVILEKIDPDIEVNGSVRFVSGCTFKWKVVYE